MKGPTAFAHFPETHQGIQLYCPNGFSPESNRHPSYPRLLSPLMAWGKGPHFPGRDFSGKLSPLHFCFVFRWEEDPTPKIECRLGRKSQIPTPNFSPVQCGTDPFHSHQTNIQEEPDLFLLFRLVIPASASSLGDRVLSSLTTEPCPALGRSWEWKEM